MAQSRVSNNFDLSKYVRHFLYPTRYVGLLQLKINALVSRKRALEKVISLQNRPTEMVTWMQSVEHVRNDVNDLLLNFSWLFNPIKLGLKVERWLETSRELENIGRQLLCAADKIDLLPVLDDTRTWEIVGLQSDMEEILSYLEEADSPVIGIVGRQGIGKTTLLKKIEETMTSSCCRRYNHKINHVFNFIYLFFSIFCYIIHVAFCSRNAKFTKVLYVEARKDSDVFKIQNEIASQLELTDFNTQTEQSIRKKRLSAALAKETFLILIDDVWDSNILENTGIQCPLTGSKSKILYATRLTGIFLHSRSERKVNMNTKNFGLFFESWKIFFAVAYSNSCFDNHLTSSFALDLASYCVFEPPLWAVRIGIAAALATSHEERMGLVKLTQGVRLLNTKIAALIARWKNYTSLEWIQRLQHARTSVNDLLYHVRFDYRKCALHLDIFNEVVTAMANDIQLNRMILDKAETSCLKLCTLFEDPEHINRQRLIEYCVWEELVFEELNFRVSLAELRLKADGIVKQLVEFHFLEEGSDTAHLKMHHIIWCMVIDTTDTYRDMCFEAHKIQQATRASICIPIPKRPHPVRCRRLITLFMRDRRLCKTGSSDFQCNTIEVQPNFFLRMGFLRVLDMSGQPIKYLPKSVFRLRSLQYINLSYTLIEMVPPEFGELVSLKCLDLSSTTFLSSIAMQAIYPLVNLRSLKLYGSSYRITNIRGQISFSHLENMEMLEELELPLQDFVTLNSLCRYNGLLTCLVHLQFANIYDQCSHDPLKVLVRFRALSSLSLNSCILAEEVKIYGTFLKTLMLHNVFGVSKITIDIGCWGSLSTLQISRCSDLKDISCLCQLQELQILNIEECEGIEELLNEPEHERDAPQLIYGSGFHYTDDYQYQCFKNLKSLRLDQLPELKSISHGLLLFGSLERISVYGCPKLNKLPLFSASGKQCTRKIKIHCDKEWWDRLEWKDNDSAKLAFFPARFFAFSDVRNADLLNSIIQKIENRINNPRKCIKCKGCTKKVEAWIKRTRNQIIITGVALSEHRVDKHRRVVDHLQNAAKMLLCNVKAFKGEDCRLITTICDEVAIWRAVLDKIIEQFQLEELETYALRHEVGRKWS